MTPQGFHIPRVLDALDRPRLFDLLRSHALCRVVLVTGQAAQGKSTLVARYLDNGQDPCLWFHLHRGASDHTVLFDTLVTGIRQVVPDPGLLSHLPYTPLGTVEDRLRQMESLALLLHRVQERLNKDNMHRDVPAVNSPAPKYLNIVLDDMESLDSQGTAFGFLEDLIRESPDQIRFFLLSRTLPPMNLSQVRMKKQLLVLGNQDLAFTREETRAFFRMTAALSDLGAGDVDKIFAITEGWAGGLTLVAEAVRHSHDLAQLPDRLTSEAFSYFSGEIYHALAPQIRDFLMESALFEELDTRILAAFFKDIDPREVLDQLEERNLFIQRIRADRQWPVFKYNNLFRDFLMNDLMASMDPGAVRALNRKAGRIFWENKDHEKAIPFFLAARDFTTIARIIRIKGADHVIRGRAARLARWIRELPDDMVAEDPWLGFFEIMARRIKGGKKNIIGFSRALDLFRQNRDERGILLCLAYLIEASVFIRQPSHVIIKWISQGEEALRKLKGQQRYTWARTLLWQQIGLGYIAGNGDIPKGISACRNAILLAQGIENQDLVRNSSVILALGFVQSGDFSGAREMLERIQDITQEGRYPEYRALKNIIDIDFSLKRGAVEKAGQLLAESEADIEKFGLIFLYPGFVEARAVYYISCAQYVQADQAADHLSDFSILEGNDFYLGIAHRIKAMNHLCQAQYGRAGKEAGLAVQELGRSRRGDIHLYLARQIYGFVLYHTGEQDRAIEELAEALAYFRQIGSDLSFCETALILGLAHYTSTGTFDAASGAACLAAGFQKAAKNQYRYFPLVDAPSLALAMVHSVRSVAGPAGLSAFFSGLMDERLGRAVHKSVCDCLDQATKKERAGLAEQLRWLYKLARPRIRINTLGAFSVLVNGRRLDKSAFGGAKPILLLKAVVLNNARDIPKEILIDALWPDASASAGDKNFKINLHRLRKALEPSPVKEFGHAYLRLKAGRISLDPDLIRIDADLFAELAAQGRAHEDSDRLESALDCYTRAAAVYQGDYFCEEPYQEWIGQRREAYRRTCIEILSNKARIHEELSQWQAAVDAWQDILVRDPAHEAAFQNLMILYADAGRKTDALQIFSRCRQALKQELDAEPDPRTIEIFERINAL